MATEKSYAQLIEDRKAAQDKVVNLHNGDPGNGHAVNEFKNAVKALNQLDKELEAHNGKQ